MLLKQEGKNKVEYNIFAGTQSKISEVYHCSQLMLKH